LPEIGVGMAEIKGVIKHEISKDGKGIVLTVDTKTFLPQLFKDKFYIAIDEAAKVFNDWNEVTGCFVKHTSYYHECLSCIEDAVKIGMIAALNLPSVIEGEFERKEE
jgi:hypothetical protein